IMPDAKTLGVIATSSDDSAQTQAKMVAKIGPKEGFTVKRYAISSTNDLNQVATQMVSQVDAVFVPTDNTVASAMQTLVAAANARKVPIFPTVDTMVKQGGVATIGLNQFDLGVET
ncbi:ABC transporter substrate binding protein, partial [Lacticaseibacillus paracasei]